MGPGDCRLDSRLHNRTLVVYTDAFRSVAIVPDNCLVVCSIFAWHFPIQSTRLIFGHFLIGDFGFVDRIGNCRSICCCATPRWYQTFCGSNTRWRGRRRAFEPENSTKSDDIGSFEQATFEPFKPMPFCRCTVAPNNGQPHRYHQLTLRIEPAPTHNKHIIHKSSFSSPLTYHAIIGSFLVWDPPRSAWFTKDFSPF